MLAREMNIQMPDVSNWKFRFEMRVEHGKPDGMSGAKQVLSKVRVEARGHPESPLTQPSRRRTFKLLDKSLALCVQAGWTMDRAGSPV